MSFSRFARRPRTPNQRGRVLLAALMGLALFIAISAAGAYTLLPMLQDNASKLANAAVNDNPNTCYTDFSRGDPVYSYPLLTQWKDFQVGDHVTGATSTVGRLYAALYYCPAFSLIFAKFSYAPTLRFFAAPILNGHCSIAASNAQGPLVPAQDSTGNSQNTCGGKIDARMQYGSAKDNPAVPTPVPDATPSPNAAQDPEIDFSQNHTVLTTAHVGDVWHLCWKDDPASNQQEFQELASSYFYQDQSWCSSGSFTITSALLNNTGSSSAANTNATATAAAQASATANANATATAAAATATAAASGGASTTNTLNSTDVVTACPDSSKNNLSPGSVVGLNTTTGGFICFGSPGFMNFSRFLDANGNMETLATLLPGPQTGIINVNGFTTIPAQGIDPGTQWISCVYVLGMDQMTVTPVLIPAGTPKLSVPDLVDIVGIYLAAPTTALTDSSSCPAFSGSE